MQHSCKELKRIARENLNDNYNIPMGAFIIATAVACMIELPFSYLLDTEYATTSQHIIYLIVEFLISIISGVLDVGLIYLHLNIARHKPFNKSDVFYAFKNQTDKFIFGYLFVFALQLLCALPLLLGYMFIFDSKNIQSIAITIGLGLASVILYTILKIIYCFIFYIMLDHPQMTLKECIKIAREIIKGHFFKTLYIYISFVGMMLLTVLSLFVGLLWLQPYMAQTMANYYLDVCGELPPTVIANNSSEYKRVDYSV